MQRKSLIVSMLFALLTFSYAPLVHAGYDYETSYDCAHNVEHRVAGEADDWIERGRAAVTGSPVFADGIRLSAWAGEEEEDYEPGLASAIYRFVVPPGTHYLKILVRYRDASEEDVVAGRLWIKTADDHVEREMESEEEAPLYGDTFVLRSDRTSETICVPAARHEDNGKVELHVVADGKDCLDVKYVRVEYRRRRPVALRIIARPYYDYWHVWPWHRYVYHYYYWGPCVWPRPHMLYEWWHWPCGFYWSVWRPWFRRYVRVHCCYAWWGPRRYTAIYRCDPDDPPARKRALFRKRLKERHVSLEEISPSHSVRETVRAPSQIRTDRTQQVRMDRQIRVNLRSEGKIGLDPRHRQLKERPARVQRQKERRLLKPHTIGRKYPQARGSPRSKTRSGSSYRTSKTQMRQSSQKRVQHWTSPRISRPQPGDRDNSRIHAVRTGETRQTKQIRGRPEIRGRSWSRTHVQRGLLR